MATRTGLGGIAWAAAMLACSTVDPPAAATAGPSAPSASTPAGATDEGGSRERAARAAPPAAASSTGVVATPASVPAAPDRRPLPDLRRADEALTIGATSPPSSCAAARSPADVLRCRIDARWSAVPDVHPVALALWDEHHVVVGLEPEHWMDGGFRGRLHLVPEPPTGRHARHLGRVRDAHAVIDRVLGGAATSGGASGPMRFRHEGVVYGFFRSVGRTTPSAYASSWRIGYNVSGSLLGTRDGVIDTLFHEIFHLNDEGDRWSEANLRAIHDAIVARCGARSACLAPYAPTKTIVRGGTYYAFQPGNGDAVHEYAAEVATRWFQEHRPIVEGTRSVWPTPFKCGPGENGRAWAAVTEAFFAGVDLVPPCPAPP